VQCPIDAVKREPGHTPHTNTFTFDKLAIHSSLVPAHWGTRMEDSQIATYLLGAAEIKL